MKEQYQELERPLKIHLVMRGNQVTGWSPCLRFAHRCAGNGEHVVTVQEGDVV